MPQLLGDQMGAGGIVVHDGQRPRRILEREGAEGEQRLRVADDVEPLRTRPPCRCPHQPSASMRSASNATTALSAQCPIGEYCTSFHVEETLQRRDRARRRPRIGDAAAVRRALRRRRPRARVGAWCPPRLPAAAPRRSSRGRSAARWRRARAASVKFTTRSSTTSGTTPCEARGRRARARRRARAASRRRARGAGASAACGSRRPSDEAARDTGAAATAHDDPRRRHRAACPRAQRSAATLACRAEIVASGAGSPSSHSSNRAMPKGLEMPSRWSTDRSPVMSRSRAVALSAATVDPESRNRWTASHARVMRARPASQASTSAFARRSARARARVRDDESDECHGECRGDRPMPTPQRDDQRRRDEEPEPAQPAFGTREPLDDRRAPGRDARRRVALGPPDLCCPRSRCTLARHPLG